MGKQDKEDWQIVAGKFRRSPRGKVDGYGLVILAVPLGPSLIIAFEFDETLAGIAAAGFDHFGFLGLSHDQPSLNDDGSAIPEAEATALAALARHGLAPAILVSTVLLDAPREAGLARLHGLVDQAVRFNVRVILEQGPQSPGELRPLL